MRGGLRSFFRRAAFLAAVLAALTGPAEARRFRIPIVHHGSYGTGEPTPAERTTAEDRLAAAQWDGNRATSNIPGDPQTSSRSTPAGGLLIFIVLLGAAIVSGVRRQIRRGAKALAPLLAPSAAESDSSPLAGEGFEARVAARLAEIRAGEATSAPAAAPARTFGRRTA